MHELPSKYNPLETEEKWYKFWEEKGYFSAGINPDKKPFCIVIPPPNVTGILHMGHALNNSIQDILIRYNRMKGLESLWMPGTDHAGIATQNVVEKSIAKDGLKRQDLGREKFIERVWQWKEQYGSTIIRQLKKLGSSCDWTRTRFTMDDEYSESVKEVFIRLYEKGLIYQGSYIINWCPRCQTALSDEEAPHHDLNGNLYYLKYPLCNPNLKEKHITLATTRPETMLGDTAVAVNPKDKRYKYLIGETLILPLTMRKIKIIADEMVDMKFGTGAVKVTPAHDPNDYITGKKHNLEFINIFYPDARLNEYAGKYKDMDRFSARQLIIEDLKALDLLEKIEPHQLSAGHCYRCNTIIEPYLSKQWFVKMKPLAQPAIEAVKKGRIKFYPKRWTKVYLNWMKNIQDWCISRQIWWGHRIPVYYCRQCMKSSTKDLSGVIVSRIKPEICPECKSADIYQDEDVLDTWFSSWLWPFATFYWPKKQKNQSQEYPDKELAYFYPTATLVTAPEIIFFWVARMIMAGFEFMGDIPFKDVYIHGTVRDTDGKKMSKSLGNIIDPLDIIKEYGTDALRFSLISITAAGQDVFLSKERFEAGRNFANKIWNASRFILMNLQLSLITDNNGNILNIKEIQKNKDFSLINRWIYSRFNSVLKQVYANLDKYRFNEAANLLYSFFWHEFCDWYLEIIKPQIKDSDNQIVMYNIVDGFLRALHPFMPFITEEIWQTIPHKGDSIMLQRLERVTAKIIDNKTEQKISIAFEIITNIRNMRTELEIPLNDLIEAKICVSTAETQTFLKLLSEHIKNLAKLKNLVIENQYAHHSGEYVMVLRDMHIVIPLSGVIDLEKQKTKVAARIKTTESDIRSKELMLENELFIKKAPQLIVEKEKNKLKELEDQLFKLKGVYHGLQ